MRGDVIKVRSLCLLTLAVVLAMSLWFVSAAIITEMTAETPMSARRQALLSSGVQIGFVAGALISAVLGLADRFDPRRLFALAAILAAALNAALTVLPVGGDGAVAARIAVGALLAAVYPVGMKIAVGWGVRDRGFLVGLLVGAVTLGSAAPHLTAMLGGADWRATVWATSAAAAVAGLLCLGAGLGPHHATAPRFDAGAIRLAWADRRIRLAYFGYFGHMWELYALWAWVGVAAAAAYSAHMPASEAEQLARATAFIAISAGAAVSVAAGLLADRVGKAEVAMAALLVSGCAAVLAGLSFEGPAWLLMAVLILWGAAVIPDSAQFSALVADFAPPAQAGSLMTLQTALGFALTFLTVQLTPMLAGAIGWPLVLSGLAVGPALGFMAMARLRKIA